MSEIGQGYKAVLVAFASADMDTFSLRINITDLQGQGLAQAQPHGVGGQNEYPVAKFASRGNQTFHLRNGEHIGKGSHLGWFDDVDPLPVTFEHVFPKEL